MGVDVPSNPRKVPILGIAGGIASGKSLVTEQLQALGADVIVADAAAHDVLKLEEVKRAARERWGEAIFGPDGEIDRSRLGKIVFAEPPAGPAELKYLEQIVHPPIRQVLRRQIEQLASSAHTQAIVLDVPLLFEGGWNEFCDTVIFVDSPRKARLARAAARGWSAEEYDRREAAQLPLDSKCAQSQIVIDNSTTKQSTLAQVESFWRSLKNPSA